MGVVLALSCVAAMASAMPYPMPYPMQMPKQFKGFPAKEEMIKCMLLTLHTVLPRSAESRSRCTEDPARERDMMCLPHGDIITPSPLIWGLLPTIKYKTTKTKLYQQD